MPVMLLAIGVLTSFLNILLKEFIYLFGKCSNKL